MYFSNFVVRTRLIAGNFSRCPAMLMTNTTVKEQNEYKSPVRGYSSINFGLATR